MSEHQTIKDQCDSDYQSFSEYRKFLLEGEQKVSEGLDKAILTISSAAIGFTFLVIKELYKIGNVQYYIYLQLSWLILGASLLAVLLSLLLSGHLYHLGIKQVDKLLNNRVTILKSIIERKPELEPKTDFIHEVIISKIARFFHYSSALFLVIGILFFGFFINSNFGEKSNDRSRQVQESSSTTSSSTSPTKGLIMETRQTPPAPPVPVKPVEKK